MNKRSKSITTLFTAPIAKEGELSADNLGRKPRVSSGSIRSVRDSFSQIERENEALRQALAERDGAERDAAGHETVREIDPHLIHPSPVADRYDDNGTSPAFELLVQSIRERGQEVPVLVRPHPTRDGRFETAYGHRRIRAAKVLERPVRAVVRPLSDEDLLVAQGVENSAREDLSFIERALFAFRLEKAGYDRAMVQKALSIDKAEASKMISVAGGLPEDIRRLIGRAPKIGRTRWQALVELLRDEGAVRRVRARFYDENYRQPASSDDRFAAVLALAEPPRPKAAGRKRTIVTPLGRRIASFTRTDGEATFVMQGEGVSRFADYLAEQLPSLYETYAERHGEVSTSTRKG